jgi:hypothetical protein
VKSPELQDPYKVIMSDPYHFAGVETAVKLKAPFKI